MRPAAASFKNQTASMGMDKGGSMPKLSFFVIAASSFVLLVAEVAVTVLPASTAERAQSLDANIAAVLPTTLEDRWLTVPWRTNAMKARLDAQNLNRPLFLWIMNGNPMGCT
jgi:hypothetical protein